MEITASSDGPPPLPVASLGFFGWVGRFFDYFFGLVVILIGLAALSAVPIVHFLSLGYLLEASARVAVSGRIRDGFIGLRSAAWIGKLLVAGWLIFLPIRLLHSYWIDARIIDPGGGAGDNLGVLVIVLTAVGLLAIFWAIIRGGKFRHFVWLAPLRFYRWMGSPKDWNRFKNSLFRLKESLQLFEYFKLGVFGFIGGLLWLILPVSILFSAQAIPNQGLALLVSLFGGVLLGIVTLYLPFIQTRFAVEKKFSVFRDWRSIRNRFKKAPLALWIALVVTLLFALPLYILKIELAPQEVAWIPNLVFVVFMFPARILLGWAMARSTRREQNRHWFFRWTGRLGMIPAVVVYVFIVWLTQYLSWHGSYSLLEQHAFLLPAPMLGL